MKKFKNIDTLIHSLTSDNYNEWIFVNYLLLKSNPLEVPFYLISNEELDEAEFEGELVNVKGDAIPAILKDKQIVYFLEFSTAKGIIVFLKNTGAKTETLTSDKIIRAFQYYYENDAFIDFYSLVNLK